MKTNKKMLSSSIILGVISVLLFISVISPIDAIPDIVPVAGVLDDVVAGLGAISTAIGSIVCGVKTPRFSKDQGVQ